MIREMDPNNPDLSNLPNPDSFDPNNLPNPNNFDINNLDNLDGDTLDQIGKMMGKDAKSINQVKKLLQNPAAVKEMKKMLNKTMASQGLSQPTKPRPKKIGRNEKCPCDSGKKYKKCCGCNTEN